MDGPKDGLYVCYQMQPESERGMTGALGGWSDGFVRPCF